MAGSRGWIEGQKKIARLSKHPDTSIKLDWKGIHIDILFAHFYFCLL